MSDPCVFCDVGRERREGRVLFETGHFYVTPVAYGPFGAGHVLVVSKFHIPCYGAMPAEHDGEFGEIIEKTRGRIATAFAAPFSAEMGVYGQSIGHAHRHMFPARAGHYRVDTLLEGLPLEVRISPVSDMHRLRAIFREEGEYVFLEERGAGRVLHTRGFAGRSLRLRSLFAAATGNMESLDWRTLPPETAGRCAAWVSETIRVMGEL